MERVWIPAIRRLMAAKGWSQAKLSEVSGVRPNTISDVLNENDPSNPQMDTMVALAKGLGVPLWAMYCDDREFALFSEQVRKADESVVEAARQEQLRAVVQAELAPMVDAILAKLTGGSAAKPEPAAHPRPVEMKRGKKTR